MKLVYIVVWFCGDDGEDSKIDSVWTSLKKAEKRCKELRDRGIGLYEVATEVVKH